MLCAATVLGMPVRLESSALFATVVLFAYRGDVPALRAIWARHRALLIVLATSLALGAVATWAVHAHEGAARLAFDPAVAALTLATRVTLLFDPVPVYYLPPLVVALVWYAIYRAVRARDGRALRAIYLPILVGALPFLFDAGVFWMLPAAGYHLVAMVFVLVAAADAFDRYGDALADRLRRSGRAARVALLCAAVPCAYYCVIDPYFHTYAYQQQWAFLQRALPRTPATVLVIWDPDTSAGDFDCCLALPYPTLLADFPELRWRVVRRRDAPAAPWRDGQFDWYYPGSMPSLDIESLEIWHGRLVTGTAARRAAQRQHLREVQALDAAVRAAFPDLIAARRATVPAYTFSSVAFTHDQMELGVYTRSRALHESPRRAGASWHRAVRSGARRTRRSRPLNRRPDRAHGLTREADRRPGHPRVVTLPARRNRVDRGLRRDERSALSVSAARTTSLSRPRRMPRSPP